MFAKSNAKMSTAIPIILKGLALFGMTTGSLNFFRGTDFLAGPTAFPPKTVGTALADNQIRYLGGAFAGTSAIVWWISNDIAARQVPLALIAAGVFTGGLGRAVAASKHGSFGSGNMKAAMWVELVVPVLFFVYGRLSGTW